MSDKLGEILAIVEDIQNLESALVLSGIQIRQESDREPLEILNRIERKIRKMQKRSAKRA